MKITQDVRDYAAAQGLSEDRVLAEGLAAKAAEFKQSGEELYLAAPATAAAGPEATSGGVGRPLEEVGRPTGPAR
jgi:phosphomethylpyrimidine synthase